MTSQTGWRRWSLLRSTLKVLFGRNILIPVRKRSFCSWPCLFEASRVPLAPLCQTYSPAPAPVLAFSVASSASTDVPSVFGVSWWWPLPAWLLLVTPSKSTLSFSLGPFRLNKGRIRGLLGTKDTHGSLSSSSKCGKSVRLSICQGEQQVNPGHLHLGLDYGIGLWDYVS